MFAHLSQFTPNCEIESGLVRGQSSPITGGSFEGDRSTLQPVMMMWEITIKREGKREEGMVKTMSFRRGEEFVQFSFERIKIIMMIMVIIHHNNNYNNNNNDNNNNNNNNNNNK